MVCLNLLVTCILVPSSLLVRALPASTSFGGQPSSSLQTQQVRLPSAFGFKGPQAFQQFPPSGFNYIQGGLANSKFGGIPGAVFGAGGPYGAVGRYSAGGPYGRVPHGAGGPGGYGYGYGAGGGFGAGAYGGLGTAYRANKLYGGGFNGLGAGGKNGYNSNYLLNALKAQSAAALAYNRHRAGYQQGGAYPTLGKQYGAIAARYPASLGFGGSYAKYGPHGGGQYGGLNFPGQAAAFGGGFGRQGHFGARLQQLPYGGVAGGKQVPGGYGGPAGYGGAGYGRSAAGYGGSQGVAFGSFGMLGGKRGFTPYGSKG